MDTKQLLTKLTLEQKHMTSDHIHIRTKFSNKFKSHKIGPKSHNNTNTSQYHTSFTIYKSDVHKPLCAFLFIKCTSVGQCILCTFSLVNWSKCHIYIYIYIYNNNKI